MCYGSGCPLELPSGKCGHKRGLWPCDFESFEEYEEATQDYEDEMYENLYERQMERKWGQ